MELTKQDILIHLISDGRDTGPKSFSSEIARLEKLASTNTRVSLASISGRFYAMDRDKRWERTQLAYNAIIEGTSAREPSLTAYLDTCYKNGITDEFIEPRILQPHSFQKEDAVIFWNFRSDRMRQIVQALYAEDFSGFKRNNPLPAKDRLLCFSQYDPSFGLPYLFSLDEIANGLGETISKAGLTQLRVAETEKYPHVTYFLNGGVEIAYAGEDRAMVQSPRDVKTYDLKPEMSAQGVCDIVCKALREKNHHLIIVNFANCDMVGHTGVLQAAITAVETVDSCLGKILQELEKVHGQALIIADHGNAEQMINYEDGTPHTSHTTFPVPCCLVEYPSSGHKLRSGGALCDIAPTILRLLEIPQPIEMTGKSLI